jgi:transposase
MSDQKRGIKGRVYLTAKEVSPAAQTFGCDRFVYNRLLELGQKRYATDWTKTYKQDRDVERNRLKAEFPWLYDVNAQMLQQSKGSWIRLGTTSLALARQRNIGKVQSSKRKLAGNPHDSPKARSLPRRAC